VEPTLFDDVGDVLRGLLGHGFGALRCRPRRWGIKVWFDTETPPREHYEAQVIGAEGVPDARVLGLEIGFHSEHTKAAENEALLARLLAAEEKWRPALGDEAVAGAFIGPKSWRRISETWPDPDLSGDDIAIEIAVRLNDYINALEPVRRS
jgi:hypothetical protein